MLRLKDNISKGGCIYSSCTVLPNAPRNFVHSRASRVETLAAQASLCDRNPWSLLVGGFVRGGAARNRRTALPPSARRLAAEETGGRESKYQVSGLPMHVLEGRSQPLDARQPPIGWSRMNAAGHTN